MKARTIVLVEHEPIDSTALCQEDSNFLRKLVPSVLKYKNGGVAASNWVGILTTPSGLVVEILPKIELAPSDGPDSSSTREAFLKMLRRSRSMPRQATDSLIRQLKNFPMLTFFVRQFLQNLAKLAHEGLARKYVLTDSNLPFVRGRLLFREQVRLNHSNQAMSYVEFSELSENRPVNRLIASTLYRLDSIVDDAINRKLLNSLKFLFADVPQSQNVAADWNTHHVDRSMKHYANVMQWIGLFLFNKGLATYAGQHVNLSLLFPMETVFEEFVADSMSRYQEQFLVKAQHPKKYLASLADECMFLTKPDIALLQDNRVRFVLDAKWKRLNQENSKENFGISQSDLYQLYTYGNRYDCESVALIYPKTHGFTRTLRYKFFDNLSLVCYPFDVLDPERSVQDLVAQLHS